MFTGEFGQNVHAILFSFFPTGPSDEYDSALSRKYTGQFVPFSPVSVDVSFYEKKLGKNDNHMVNHVKKTKNNRFSLVFHG